DTKKLGTYTVNRIEIGFRAGTRGARQMKAIVCDAGPIIHLYEARCLPLLKQTGNLFLPVK
ncbi:MAG: hypothetical protein Q7J12_05295, partial [Syntrophales bacterium]|nr:hypothetical protein [Syntrophales bacterium]